MEGIYSMSRSWRCGGSQWSKKCTEGLKLGISMHLFGAEKVALNKLQSFLEGYTGAFDRGAIVRSVNCAGSDTHALQISVVPFCSAYQRQRALNTLVEFYPHAVVS